MPKSYFSMSVVRDVSLEFLLSDEGRDFINKSILDFYKKDLASAHERITQAWKTFNNNKVRGNGPEIVLSDVGLTTHYYALSADLNIYTPVCAEVFFEDDAEARGKALFTQPVEAPVVGVDDDLTGYLCFQFKEDSCKNRWVDLLFVPNKRDERRVKVPLVLASKKCRVFSWLESWEFENNTSVLNSLTLTLTVSDKAGAADEPEVILTTVPAQSDNGIVDAAAAAMSQVGFFGQSAVGCGAATAESPVQNATSRFFESTDNISEGVTALGYVQLHQGLEFGCNSGIGDSEL